MGEKTVLVDVNATVRARIYGRVRIPAAMWERVAKDDGWSDEIEEYVADHLDYRDPDFLDDELEIDDVRLTPGQELEDENE